jgi:transitional endoplasmic reticulum ATPase
MVTVPTVEDALNLLKLRVAEADSRDVGRAIVRIDPADAAQLGLRTGDIVMVQGEQAAVGKVMPCKPEDRGASRVRIDGLTRSLAGCSVDTFVQLTSVTALDADEVVLRPKQIKPIERDLDYLAGLIDGLPVMAGGVIRVTLFGSEVVDFEVEKTLPAGPVVIVPHTRLSIESGRDDQPTRTPSYEDIGGARPQLRRIREMIELPLKFPEVFGRLGIDPPKGVLLYGPPGCGKTLIARTIAHETDAKFFSVSGPEIIHKFYGESEAHLRRIFEQAAKEGPSIVFLDEIDAIAPKRENAAGDVERRVVAQLLALMDGLSGRENVIVIAATNLPNSIDAALRRPGRFDREIEIPIPDRAGRKHILEIHSRGMPLTSSVDLEHLASITHGFVGADLEALCREAAMACLREVLDEIDFSQDKIPYEQLSALGVSMTHFMQGFQAVEPSAIREVFVEVPNVKWEDIGGLEDVKQAIREAVIWPLAHPELFERAGIRPAKGLILAGPPGCGKTTLAKAAATESQVNFISVKGPELLSKFVGESEKGVREIFSKARAAAPCIIFFDEIDGMAMARQSGQSDSGVSNRILSQFLAEMDGIEDLGQVFVLAATNRIDVLDPALQRFGRFEKIIHIGIPNEESRREILAVHLREKPIVADFDVVKLAADTEGCSGAELAAICNDAGRIAIRRAIANDSISLGIRASQTSLEKLLIQSSDFESALADLKKSSMKKN